MFDDKGKSFFQDDDDDDASSHRLKTVKAFLQETHINSMK